jgi:hypothetical protein
MEAKELRIDNYVNHGKTYGGRYKNPTQIGRYDFEDTGGYEPIPLTEEWLVKFGLKGRKDFVYNYNGFGVQIRDGIFYGAFKDLGNVIYHSTVEVKSVHQLQNLYFALTGEELIIK